MAEHFHSPPTPCGDGMRPPAVEVPVSSPSLAGLHALLVQDLPKLPSLAALHALTDRDLPSSDGLPMAESEEQYDAMTCTVGAFRRYFRDRSGVCVVGDLLVYGARGPDADGRVLPVSVAPDVMVAFGVEDRKRKSYVIWQEGKPPDFVMEIASVSTWKRDRDEKPAVYASWGVAEYFLFDPVGGFLEPRLQGHVLRGGAYRPLPSESLPNGERGLHSEVLGLWAYLKGSEGELRWYDPVAGKDLEYLDELHEARDAAETRAKAAEARARAAEDEIAELRAQIRQLQRGGSPAA